MGDHESGSSVGRHEPAQEIGSVLYSFDGVELVEGSEPRDLIVVGHVLAALALAREEDPFPGFAPVEGEAHRIRMRVSFEALPPSGLGSTRRFSSREMVEELERLIDAVSDSQGG